MNAILLVVDPQIDFITGSLAVPGAEEAMKGLCRHILERPGEYSRKIVSLDSHPWTHCSFRENGGEWPRHCVADDVGAAIYPPLLAALHSTPGPVSFCRKGQNPDREEYSLFRNEENLKTVPSLLREADRIDICGVAGDICVLNTLKDGAELLGSDKFRVLREFSPSLDGGKSLSEYVERLGR